MRGCLIIGIKNFFDPYIALFSSVLFLSAALMFSLELMVGKMLLPLVGGAPSGWLVALSFFQLALLSGYYFAYRLSFLPIRMHGLVVFALLAAGLLTQPIHLSHDFFKMKELPESMLVFMTLFVDIASPFVALSMLTPSLQRLFAARRPGSTQDPYFLFASSNLGSLVGLLAYPFWIERVIGLHSQAMFWSVCYGVLILLCGLCLLSVGRKEPASNEQEQQGFLNAEIAWKSRGTWLLLAFVPSSLLMGVTDQIEVEVGSLPLFWIIPLALYLLTFVLAFTRLRIPFLKKLVALQPACVALVTFDFLLNPLAPRNGIEYAVLPLIVFFLTSLLCNLILAATRPPLRHLTTFYLYLALGGFLGGVLNAFLVPMLFPLPYEFALVALASCLVRSPWRKDHAAFPPFSVVVAAAAAIGVCLWQNFGTTTSPVLPFGDFLLDATMIVALLEASTVIGMCLWQNFWATIGPVLPLGSLLLGTTMIVALVTVSKHPRTLVVVALTLGSIGLLALGQPRAGMPRLLAVNRNFFGVTRVYERQDGPNVYRILYNGSASHTMEKTAPEYEVGPSDFLDKDGAIENVVALQPFPDIAIVGLGGGAMLCYQNYMGFHHRFVAYEINPAVVGMAEKWFDYFRKCARPQIRIGDARASLAADAGAKYNLIIIDVFTSDVIPVHLLTREAFQLYFDRLTKNGVIAFHVYSRYYDLRRPIGALVKELGAAALYKLPHASGKILWGHTELVPSPWIAIARDASVIAPLRDKGWEDLPPSTDRVWTDDYSDTLSALK